MRDRILHGVRSLWGSVGVAILVLVLIEGVGQAALAVRDRGLTAPRWFPEDRFEPGVEGGAKWLKPYLRELRVALRYEWHPYVYWRAMPYRGTYVNIDEKGIRRTWNSLSSSVPGQLRIWMFGGSTLWGLGSRDEFTIASQVSKRLSTLGIHAWVTNFGESGYVSTQEVIALMLELQKGNVPDIVVFYDGVNDAWAAFQSRVAGIPENEMHRAAEFNSRSRLNWRGGVVEKLALYRFTRSTLGSLGRARSSAAMTSEFLNPALASAVVDAYLANVRTVSVLAREHRFQAVFFWQPTVFSKRNLSEREKRWYVHTGRADVRDDALPIAEGYRVFNRVFQEKATTSGLTQVHDLSEVFSEEFRTVFVDRFHMSDLGNDRVAEAMVQTLQGIARDARR
jgi:lysophospholipase L1-like esterase